MHTFAFVNNEYYILTYCTRCKFEISIQTNYNFMIIIEKIPIDM